MTTLAEEVRAVPAWYHTIDLAPGVTSPGYYDLRPVVDRLPWPDVRGKRCLDVGSQDGFYAFELARRGAAEVVAVDVPDRTKWDWPLDARQAGLALSEELAGPQNAPGFDIARRALEVDVQREFMTIYELDPERIGTFDVVVVGSLLLHLRDPLRALAAVRSVCNEWLLSTEEVRLNLSLPWQRRPLAELNGHGQELQWFVPGVVGHRRMLTSAGFTVERTTKPFPVLLGVGHPSHGSGVGGIKGLVRRVMMGRSEGVPHASVLARAAS